MPFRKAVDSYSKLRQAHLTADRNQDSPSKSMKSPTSRCSVATFPNEDEKLVIRVKRTEHSNSSYDIHSLNLQPFVRLCNECTQKEAKILELQAICSTQQKLIDELTAKLAEANEKTKPAEKSQKQEQKQVIRIVKILKTCTVCGVGKMTPEQNQQHICNGTKKIECQYCDQIFASISDLFVHLSSHEFEKVVYKCKLCPKAFGMEMLLQFHLKVHQNAEKMVVIPSENVFPSKPNKIAETYTNTPVKVVPAKEPIPPVVFPVKPSEKPLSNTGIEFHSNKPVKVVEAKTPFPTDVRPFKCGSCGLCFATGQHLQRHMLDNHRNVYKCVVCKSKFKSLEEVRIHVRSHTGDEKCLVCNEICTKTQIETHMCSDQDSIECSYCLQSFSVMKSLLQHLKECNREKCFYDCIHCSEKFMMKSIAEIHMDSHKEALSKQNQQPIDENEIITKSKIVEPFYCTISSRGFAHKELMKQYKSSHDAEAKKTHLCDLCGKGFLWQSNLINHRLTHSEKTIKCPKCDAKFLTKAGLKRHSARHSDPQFICDICGKAVTNREKLKAHSATHTRTETDRKYGCSICERKFFTRKNLRNHIKTHTATKRFECEYCKHKYKYKGDLNKHLREMHLGDDMYRCGECSKHFRTPWDLERHKFEHYVPTEDKKDDN